MILASAIKFRMKNKNGDEVEVVLCGNRHNVPWEQLETLGFTTKDVFEDTEGFIDNKNRFYTRKEAFAYVVEIGQLADRIRVDRQQGGVGGTNLISEDLW